MSLIMPQKYSSAEQLSQGSPSLTMDSHPAGNNLCGDNTQTTISVNAQSRLLRLGTHLSKFKLEMVLFLYYFSHVMTRVSSTTMILDKVCLVHFGYPSLICDHLQNHTKIKTSVERLATNYQLGHTLIQNAPAAVLACFIGPWSDKHGRKFPLLFTLFGMILDSIGSTVCAYFLETRVEYYFIPAIFTGIFGGPVALLTVVYSYASDSTPFAKRTIKYALVQISYRLATPLGTTAGGWIYKFFGYTTVFFFSTCGLCLSLICVVFLLKETRGLDNDDPLSVKLRQLFTCSTFKEGFIATAKERPHRGRQQVVLLVLSVCFLVVEINSSGDINYLYAHHLFDWSNTTFSTISSIYSVVGVFVLIIVVPLLKYYKVDDPYLGLLGSISLFGKNIGIGFARNEGVYHTANLIGLLGNCSILAVRSRISKVVPNEDLGKVFSFVTIGEFIFPILNTVLMSQIFRAFLETFPGMPYITLGITTLLPIGVFSWMMCLPSMRYEDIDHTAKQKDETIHSIRI